MNADDIVNLLPEGPGSKDKCERCHYTGLDLWILPDLGPNGEEIGWCRHCLTHLIDLREVIKAGKYGPESDVGLLVGLCKDQLFQ